MKPPSEPPVDTETPGEPPAKAIPRRSKGGKPRKPPSEGVKLTIEARRFFTEHGRQGGHLQPRADKLRGSAKGGEAMKAKAAAKRAQKPSE